MCNFEVVFNNGKREQVDKLGIMRKTSGQTQKQVAAKIRRSISYVSGMDRYSPIYDQAIALAEYAKANGFRTNIQFIQQGCSEERAKEATSETLEDLVEKLADVSRSLGAASGDSEEAEKLSTELRALKREILCKYGEKLFYRG